MSLRGPKSLHLRLVGTVTVSLALFLAAAGWMLDRSFAVSVMAATDDRLRSRIYMLLGAVEVDDTGALQVPEQLPDASLATPGSGSYARILDHSGRIAWRSSSLLGITLPDLPVPNPGAYRSMAVDVDDGSSAIFLATSVIWELADGGERRYTVQMGEDRSIALTPIRRFRGSLLRWFGAAVLILLIVQLLLLRWGLRPIRRVALEIKEIESGSRTRISDDYPRELRPLTVNLNKLLGTGRIRLARYREGLADLAHTLKTPLAVIRGAIEQRTPESQLLHEQFERIERTIEYHLKRAAAAGHEALAREIEVEPLLQKLAVALRKVYWQRNLTLSVNVAPGTTCSGDESDLYEIAGNLADNACKWARATVTIDARNNAVDEGHPGFTLIVSDDGAGIPASDLEAVLRRGVRADERMPGQGIGLAVVRQLVEGAYQGTLRIESGSDGTRVTVDLPIA